MLKSLPKWAQWLIFAYIGLFAGTIFLSLASLLVS
jgi:hypothetical protein